MEVPPVSGPERVRGPDAVLAHSRAEGGATGGGDGSSLRFDTALQPGSVRMEGRERFPDVTPGQHNLFARRTTDR